MLFNSYIFIFLFFPLTLIGYFGLNYAGRYRAAMAFLVGMSFWFYGYNNIRYLVILVISILINYGIVAFMNRTPYRAHRKFYLGTGILLNIGILFYFKYYDFFIENLNGALKTDLPFLRLALPLGISFYTFQQLSYVIDSYRKECEPYSLLEYAAYVSYFPQLIAGPIVYHSELIPQLKDPKNKTLCFENLSRGIYAFALGLAKKVLIADTFSKIVTIGYGSIGELNSPSALLVMVCYSLQIYFDFSGYCDMAYGMGYMMNIKLPFNFNSPYKAKSVNDFWDRWHMTLTRFFTKYIYIPLGGSRNGQAKTCRNVMIVFLVSGLWHGASWTFIIWGALHGLASVLERIITHLKNKYGKNPFRQTNAPSGSFFSRLKGWSRLLLTFSFVTFAWSLFRAPSLQEASHLWNRLLTGGFGPVYEPITDGFQDLIEISFLYRAGFSGLISAFPWLPVALFTAAVLTASFVMKNTQEKTAVLRLTTGKLLTVVVLMLWSILSLAEISEFLYFNF